MTGQPVAPDFSRWIGRKERVDDPLAWVQAQAAQATLDEVSPPIVDGDALPLPWHWFHFLERTPQAELDDNGHARLGDFMPPVPYPRRMFAGARMRVHHPLRVGTVATREGEIKQVALKTGSRGPLAFVTVAYRFVQQGRLCVEEEQDIVYRELGERVDSPQAAALPPLPPDTWSRTVRPDARQLFRFSALTFNAHRIHYDHDYVRAVEGYPGLVVHGTLTATLLLQLVRQSTPRPVLAFGFRALAPLFEPAAVRLSGRRVGDEVALQAHGPDGALAMTASATLG
ncbi:MAG: MaoC family dehydratase N-terminal domain-containing protein [Rubrivivax sp.]|nr:MaoC family dehydratase N-terminal domain-containing protein [Rubrivivax sp.]